MKRYVSKKYCLTFAPSDFFTKGYISYDFLIQNTIEVLVCVCVCACVRACVRACVCVCRTEHVYIRFPIYMLCIKPISEAFIFEICLQCKMVIYFHNVIVHKKRYLINKLS